MIDLIVSNREITNTGIQRTKAVSKPIPRLIDIKTGQFQSIREQAGTFADSIKLWSEP